MIAAPQQPGGPVQETAGSDVHSPRLTLIVVVAPLATALAPVRPRTGAVLRRAEVIEEGVTP